MTLQDIQQKLVRLTSIVDRWSEGRMNAIERDIALEHLRSIYESLSAATPGDIAPATEPADMPEQDRPSDEIIVTAVEPVEEAVEEPAGEPVETEEHAEVTVAETVVESAEERSEAADNEDADRQSIIADPLDIDLLLGLTESDMVSHKDESAPAAAVQDAGTETDQAQPATEHDAEANDAMMPQSVEEDAEESPAEDLPETGMTQSQTEPEAESVPIEAQEQPAEPQEQEQEQPAVQTPAQAPHASVMAGLFDMEQIPVRSKRRRNVMISLYDDDPKKFDSAPEPKPAPMPAPDPAPSPERDPEPYRVPASSPIIDDAPEQMPDEQQTEIAVEAITEEPASPQSEAKQPASEQPAPEPKHFSAPVTPPAEQPTRLADVLGGGITTLADTLAGEHHTARTVASSHIDSLRSAIGINDRFLMIRDLFNGNEQMFEDTITTLDEFDDLDECMIYIVENFAWNPDSDGARLLTDIIQRKLS